MGAEHRLEVSKSAVVLSDGLNSLDVTPPPNSGFEKTPPGALLAAPPEAASKPDLKAVTAAPGHDANFEAVLGSRGVGNPTWTQTPTGRISDNNKPYYGDPTSPDTVRRATGHGLLPANSLPYFIGGAGAAIVFGRGSLATRALTGLIIGGAIAVGKVEFHEKFGQYLGF